MKLRQQVDGTTVELEFRLTSREVEFRRVRQGVAEAAFRKVDVVEAEPGIYSLLIEGRCYDIRLEHAHYGTVAQHRTTRLLLEEAARGNRAQGALGSGPLPVKASMPGRVVRVLVADGDEVGAGQGLVVLEAMKMQNEIAAARAGTVRRLVATEGKIVVAGEMLCLLE